LDYDILVINLAEARERRQRICDHLAQLGVTSMQMVDAVRGDRLAADERALRADDARTLDRYGRVLTPGELGCALSHVRAYDMLLAGPQAFALILEDDAVLLPEAIALLERAPIRQWLLRPEPRLLLMTPIRSYLLRGARPVDERYRLVGVRRAWEGYGYVLNRAAAAVMRRINSPAWLSADDWVAYRKLGGVELGGLDPFCIGYLDSAPSQLELDRRRVENAGNRSRSLRTRLEKWCRQGMDALYYKPVWGLGQQRMPPGWPGARD
jgi:glycosyl transferase family 25